MSSYGGRPIQFFNLAPFAVEHTVAVRWNSGTNSAYEYKESYDPLEFEQTPFSRIVGNWGKNYEEATTMPEKRRQSEIRRESERKRMRDAMKIEKALETITHSRYHPYN